MMRFPHLAQRLFNVPLAIHPSKAEIIVAALAQRMGIGQPIEISSIGGLAFDQDDEQDFRGSGKNPRGGYDVVADVAVIQIEGTLVKKLGTLRPESGMTGYDGIRQNFLTALADPAVDAILLDIDSPGGEVSGCFDLVDTIYAARGTKPVWATLNERAYSAAYAIASAADVITVPRTGGVGSIGVMTVHVDLSGALSSAGLKVTFIQYGAQKTEGASEVPLEPEALKRMQSDIDMMGELFVDTVSRNRAISSASVRETEAGTYLGMAGVERGLADVVMAPDEAFRALLKTLNRN